MRYTLPDGKRINIPDAFIERTMRSLEVDRAEAVRIYLDDEGYTKNQMVQELTQKAKDNKAIVHDAGSKPKRKPPVRKPDEIKRAIVASLTEMLGEINGITNLKIPNVERIISFEYANENYEVTLTRKRKPKE